MVKELPSILCPESLKHYSIGGGEYVCGGGEGAQSLEPHGSRAFAHRVWPRTATRRSCECVRVPAPPRPPPLYDREIPENGAVQTPTVFFGPNWDSHNALVITAEFAAMFSV